MSIQNNKEEKDSHQSIHTTFMKQLELLRMAIQLQASEISKIFGNTFVIFILVFFVNTCMVMVNKKKDAKSMYRNNVFMPCLAA